MWPPLQRCDDFFIAVPVQHNCSRILNTRQLGREVGAHLIPSLLIVENNRIVCNGMHKHLNYMDYYVFASKEVSWVLTSVMSRFCTKEVSWGPASVTSRFCTKGQLGLARLSRHVFLHQRRPVGDPCPAGLKTRSLQSRRWRPLRPRRTSRRMWSIGRSQVTRLGWLP